MWLSNVEAKGITSLLLLMSRRFAFSTMRGSVSPTVTRRDFIVAIFYDMHGVRLTLSVTLPSYRNYSNRAATPACHAGRPTTGSATGNAAAPRTIKTLGGLRHLLNYHKHPAGGSMGKGCDKMTVRLEDVEQV